MNKLDGIVEKISQTTHIALIQVRIGEDLFSSVLLKDTGSQEEIKIGDKVAVLFKESEVSIGKNLQGGLSMRNRLCSVIKEIEKGTVLTKLVLDYQGWTIQSVITTASTERLELKPGEEVECLIKSNEVTIMTLE